MIGALPLPNNRLARLALLAGMGLLGLFVLTVFAIYVRLAVGDVSGAWLKRFVDGQLASAKPDGLVLDYQTLSVGLTATGQPIARLTDLYVKTPNQLVEVSASSAEVVLDFPSLLMGSVVAHRVDLVGGAIDTVLPYMENGPLQRPIPFGVAFIDTGLQLVRDAIDGKLSEANLSDMRVSFSRPEWPRPVDYYPTQVTIGWSKDGIEFNGSFVGSDGSWTVSLDRERQRSGLQGRKAFLEIANVAPRDLIGNPRLAGVAEEPSQGMETGGFPITMKMDASFGEGSQVASVVTDIRTGVGWMGPKANPNVILDEMRLQLSYKEGEEQLSVDALEIVGGRTSIAATGSFRPPWFTTTGRGEFLLQADAPVLAFSTDETAIETVGVQAHGFVDLNNSEFVLTRADLLTDEAALAARGRFAFGDAFPEVSFAGKLRDVGLEKAFALWPALFGAEARSWAETHFKGGHIESAELAFRLGEAFFDGNKTTPSWTEGDIQGSFALRDVDLMVTDGLPIVERIDAQGIITGQGLNLISEPIMPVLASGRTVELSPMRISVTGLETSNAEITLTGSLGGEAASVVEVFGGFLPDVLTDAGIDPNAITGTANIDTNFVFANLEENAEGPTRWSIKGSAEDLGSSTKLQGREISDGDLTFEVDQDRAKVTGAVALDGVVAEVDVDRTLLELEGGIASGVAFTLDADMRKKLGLDFGDALTGSVNVSLVGSDEEGAQSFEVDLTNAGINLAQAGLSKPRGAPGSMTFSLKEEGDIRTINELTLAFDRPILKAFGQLDGEGLTFAAIESLQLSASDDVAAEIQRDGSNYRITISGNQFDLRPLLTSIKDTGDKNPSEPSQDTTQYSVSLNVARVIGHNSLVARDVKLQARTRGDTLLSAEADASVDASTLKLVWTPDGDWRNVQLDSSNIGTLLRFTDTYDRVEGGVANIQGRLPLPGNDAKGTGTLLIRDFVLKDEERLQQVEDRIQESARQRRRSRDAEQSIIRREQGGIAFVKLSGTFSQEKSLLSVSELALQGPTLGAVASGVINLDTRQLDFRGTFIPLYGLNNLFGRVPILGQILGGGERGGLLGLTFRTFGPISKPEFTINPASLLTPGIFRKVFGFEPLSNR